MHDAGFEDIKGSQTTVAAGLCGRAAAMKKGQNKLLVYRYSLRCSKGPRIEGVMERS